MSTYMPQGPEGEYEYEDEIPELPRPRRQGPWHTAAAITHEPEFFFTCCGTRYGATSPKALAIIRQAHLRRANHSGGLP